MHIPEQLFSLPLLKDVRTQPIELVFRQVGITIVAGQNGSSTGMYTVPKDRIFCLTSFGILFTPDVAGGTLTSAGVFALVGGQNHYIAAIPSPGFALGAGQPGMVYACDSSVWVPPGASLDTYMTVNVGGNHSGLLSFTGITFPRGSVSIA